VPKYKKEFVTPQIARGLMARNADNQRGLKWSKIPGYVRDMIAGTWSEDTGETIKIDHEGFLIDGQNRIQAVIEAGEKLPEGGIWFDFAYGVPREAMLVIDSGSNRSAADAMKVDGLPDRNNIASIVRWVIMWDLGNFLGTGGGSSKFIQPTHSEIKIRTMREPEAFVAASSRGTDFKRARVSGTRPIGVAHYLFCRIDDRMGKDFFDALISGANLPEKSPILVLRNRLIRAASDRVTVPEQLALTIRAWNHYRAGNELSALLISRDGKLTNANFPKPK
jgi:hypothetical protein